MGFNSTQSYSVVNRFLRARQEISAKAAWLRYETGLTRYLINLQPYSKHPSRGLVAATWKLWLRYLKIRKSNRVSAAVSAPASPATRKDGRAARENRATPLAQELLGDEGRDDHAQKINDSRHGVACRAASNNSKARAGGTGGRGRTAMWRGGGVGRRVIFPVEAALQRVNRAAPKPCRQPCE